ncbi:MAG: hypothetical protein DDG58_00155 [Ardenticatenia bacterium]|nr:MAG: hypothetical protein DDG58_00155 [Ardenticatenia bacterium]
MRRIAILICAAIAGFTVMVVGQPYVIPTNPVAIAATPPIEVPFEKEWARSGHADANAESFTHWNAETPPEIPVACAKCHSTYGYQDFLGVDGSAVGTVDKPAPVGSVITCVACHNEATIKMTSVMMPSGVEIKGLGSEARCMQCHQGRESKISVDKAIADAGVGPDEVSDKLTFRNIHYYAATATKYGTLAKGGYEYDGQKYDGNFVHVEGFSTCVQCHNPHTLELNLQACVTCHPGVTTPEQVRDIRMAGSLMDYDGDGNTQEGIYYELQGLRDMLYQAIQAYAIQVTQSAIAYDPAVYPYFFADTNSNGVADADEARFDNAFKRWTPRLLKAAYNYQTSLKDPGAYMHGGKYIIQLLYDSIADLNTVLIQPIDLSKAHRIDYGHFAGSEEAFRHWDETGAVPAACSKCHSSEGLPLYVRDKATITQPPANGFNCATCHNDLTTFTLYEVKQVEFPSGAVIDSGDPNTNLCMECHQGRESTVSVNRLVKDLPPDEVSDKLRFLNIHYFAAGATRFGTEAKGAYEYEGKTYVGLFAHAPEFSSCVSCHPAHGLQVRFEACGKCHAGVASEEDLVNIRLAAADYDGDGDTAEGVAGEIATMRELLYPALQNYSAAKTGVQIAYHPSVYPYFFADTNGNGMVDADEARFDNAFNKWTPRLLKAAYNFQYATKDPGAFTHNPKYVLQVLYDSLEDIGADVSKMTRP